MGEKPQFASFEFNDPSDVKAFEAGQPAMVEAAAEGYLSAVLKLKAAVLVGDLSGAGVAQASIAQTSEQLISLGKQKAKANEFVATDVEPS